jgi:hypothetical protein
MRIIRENREDIGGQSDWFLERRLDGLATNPAPALHRIGDERTCRYCALHSDNGR